MQTRKALAVCYDMNFRYPYACDDEGHDELQLLLGESPFQYPANLMSLGIGVARVQ